METLLLSKKIKFRLENAEGKETVFCYDVRTDTYFAMSSKYFNALKLLQHGISKEALASKCVDINCDTLVRGLAYKGLLKCTCEDNDD